ncbi:MAG TPA: hypothetical protein VK539_02400 [Myxococcaceae bacterium]|nr:hypothetical protein [Myxococcaceae bacterium]
MRKAVLNLEFPSWTKEITIHGYRFYRVNNYEERAKQLQHLVGGHFEFTIRRNTGGHSHTAYVEIPDSEPTSVIAPGPGSTALTDIILLLALFTGRDVFTIDEPIEDALANGVLVADPREAQRLGVLITSIKYRADDAGDYPPGNAGFAETINAVYSWMRSPQWRREYGPGHFLLLAKQALLHNLPWSIAFTQCWTIWEHVYGLMTRNTPKRAIKGRKGQKRVEAAEKIQAVLKRYGLKGETPKDRVRIRALAAIRNSLVHEGRFPEGKSVGEDVQLFLNLTQFLLASILRLAPSNVMNTIERFEEFLKDQEKNATTETRTNRDGSPGSDAAQAGQLPKLKRRPRPA